MGPASPASGSGREVEPVTFQSRSLRLSTTGWQQLMTMLSQSQKLCTFPWSDDPYLDRRCVKVYPCHRGERQETRWSCWNAACTFTLHKTCQIHLRVGSCKMQSEFKVTGLWSCITSTDA